MMEKKQDSPISDSSNRQEKEIVTTWLKRWLAIISVGLLGIMFLVIIIPAGSWSIRVIRGEISSSTDMNLSMENVITYSISMLTLLVTIITLGVGFIAIFGYQQLRQEAHNTAVKEARRTAKAESKNVAQKTAQEVSKVEAGIEIESLKDYLVSYVEEQIRLKKVIDEKRDDFKQSDLGFDCNGNNSTNLNDEAILKLVKDSKNSERNSLKIDPTKGRPLDDSQ